MTNEQAIAELQKEHDLIQSEHDLDGSQFAPALLEALAMAIEALNHSEIPNTSEPKCADGCIYGWGSSECGHCDYRSEESKTGDCISRKAAIDVAIKADIENNGGVLSEKRARIIDKRISAMPSAQSEREKGKWIVCGDKHVCSECDEFALCDAYDVLETGEYQEKLSDFCPNCGADMRGEQDDRI